MQQLNTRHFLHSTAVSRVINANGNETSYFIPVILFSGHVIAGPSLIAGVPEKVLVIIMFLKLKDFLR